jgi:hypothetical protein
MKPYLFQQLAQTLCHLVQCSLYLLAFTSVILHTSLAWLIRSANDSQDCHHVDHQTLLSLGILLFQCLRRKHSSN